MEYPCRGTGGHSPESHRRGTDEIMKEIIANEILEDERI
jgi:hypothetical protein